MAPINVSVKNVPDEVVTRLRQRARRHHRSLQGEVMAILEAAVGITPLSFEQAKAQIKALDLATENDATAWTRELRDAR